MILKINSELFNEELYFSNIDRILDFIIERRYELYFDDEDILDNSLWLREARLNYKELLYESFVKTLQESKKHNIEITKSDDLDNNRLSMENALIFLNNKTVIFLENAHYDKFFILGLIEKFRKRAKKIRVFFEKRWIEFRHCGGKNDAINQISEVLQTFNGEILENHIYLRAFLLLDSDKKHKFDNDSDRLKVKRKISDFCTANNIVVHFLEKREIENYIPLCIIENIDDLKAEEVDLLKSLSKEEKDFYDFEILSTKSYRTKQEFPKLFLKETLTQEMLIEECTHQENADELQIILEKINSII